MLVLPVELQPDESALIELPDGGLRLYEPPRVTSLAEGGPGSGNFGHTGVPGKHGGSAPGGGIAALPSIFKGRAGEASEDDLIARVRDLAMMSHDESAVLTINGVGADVSWADAGGVSGTEVEIGGILNILKAENRNERVQTASLIHSHPHPRREEDYSPFGIIDDLQVFDTHSRYSGLTKLVIADADGRIQTLTPKEARPDQFSVDAVYRKQLERETTAFKKKEGRSPNAVDKQALLRRTNEKMCARMGIIYSVDETEMREAAVAECGPGSGNLERDIEQELEDDHAR